MMKSLHLVMLICFPGVVAYEGAETRVQNDERCLLVETPRLGEELDSLRVTLQELKRRLETSPDDKELKDEFERVLAEFCRKGEERSRLVEELKSVMSNLEDLREKQAESPNDQELKNETERVKAEYHRKIQSYNNVMFPRSKRMMEGDMQPEDMPWDRTDGGKVSVTFMYRGKEMPVSDEEAEAVRVFLDDHVSEWLRGDVFYTEGMLNQVVFAGTVTIRKENGYSRSYVILFGEGLRWNDCYLPLGRTYSDISFDKIRGRYIKDVSKLPLDPMERALRR